MHGNLLFPCRDASDLQSGSDIRRAGEEVCDGDILATAGVRITPAVVAAAAVAGVDEMVVRRCPRVALILLGDEVVDHGIPAPGQVRDAFNVSLPEILSEAGLTVITLKHVRDDLNAVRDAIADTEVDLIISTGGTGHGHGDHLVPALQAVGASVLVRGIAMRPGHPTVLARLSDGVPVLGLPGNPFAAMVALVAIGLPLIAGLVGSPLPMVLRRMAGSALVGPSSGVRLVTVAESPEGVEPLPKQGPAMARGLLGADAIAIVGGAGVASGAQVDALLLPWNR